MQPAMHQSVIEDLSDAHQLISMSFHRNKNQHRLSTWWRWFHMLHQNIKKLLRLSVAKDRLQIEISLKFFQEILIPKCYVAFSDVVAETQYAPLGLFLISILATIHKAIGTGSADCVSSVVVPGARKNRVKFNARPLAETNSRSQRLAMLKPQSKVVGAHLTNKAEPLNSSPHLHSRIGIKPSRTKRFVASGDAVIKEPNEGHADTLDRLFEGLL